MSFWKDFLSIAGLLLGLVGGPVGKLIGLGLSFIVNGGLGKKSGGTLDTSPRYGFDNLQNPTRAGGPVPVIYGQEQVAPLIISVNVKQEGDSQVLYLLCLVCEGEIESITDVRLNDVSITSFPGASYETRLGTSTQTQIADFNQVGQPYEAGTALDNGSQHVHEMHDSADEVVFNFLYQGGLYATNSEGGIDFTNSDIRVEWKVYGAADTTYAPWIGTLNGWENRSGGTYRSEHHTTVALRKQMRVPLAATSLVGRGRYTFRLTGQVSNETRKIRVPNLANVIEVSSDQRAYADRAVLAIKCPSSAQIQGGIPRVTCVVKGKKVYDPSTATTAWSRNPVWCLRDLLVNTRYGLGRWIDSGDLDDGVGGTWRTAATACDASVTTPVGTSEARHEIDLVLDAKAPAREWIEKFTSPMRATLFPTGGKLRLVRLVSGSSIRSFSEDEGDSIRKGIVTVPGGSGEQASSLVERYLDEAERWNAVRVGYLDRDQGYQRRTLRVRDQRIAISASWALGTGFPVGTRVSAWNAAGQTVYATVTRAAVPGDAYVYFTQDEGKDGDQVIVWGTTPLTAVNISAQVATTAAPEFTTPERALEVLLLGVTRKTQALREARHHLALATLCTRMVSFDVFLGDLDLEPGDHIAITSTRLGYSAKQFTVLSIVARADGFGSIEAREYDATVFTDSIDPVPNPPSFQPGGAVTPGLVPTTPAPATTGTPVATTSAPAAAPAVTQAPTAAVAGVSSITVTDTISKKTGGLFG